MLRVSALYAFLLLVAGTLVPARASAWANAQVSSARGNVRVEEDGALRVALELDVHVLGGWLSELEVAGLDRPLVLDSSAPATFATKEGVAIPFQLVADDTGRVVFRFASNRTPRSGDYVATFAYTATLEENAVSALAESRVRYAWTFPAWAAGLDAVAITIDAPAGAQLENAAEDGFDESADVSTRDGRVLLAYRTSYLPPGVAWTLGFSLPREAVPTELRPQARVVPRVATVATSRDGRPQSSIPIIACVFTAIAILKRVFFARTARKSESKERPLIPVPLFVAILSQLGLGIAAARIWRSVPEAAMAALVFILLLTVERTAIRAGTPRLGGFRPATKADRRRARWEGFLSKFAPITYFDATRPLGLVVFAGIAFGVIRHHLQQPADSVDAIFSVPHAVALLFVLFLVGGGAMIPMQVSARLVALEAVARKLRFDDSLGDGIALRLAIHRDIHEVAQDARLRLVSEHRAAGLVRLDISMIERYTLGGFVASPALLVLVRQGSEAERILVRSAGGGSLRVAPGGRRARVLPLTRGSFALVSRLTRAKEDERACAPSAHAESESSASSVHA